MSLLPNYWTRRCWNQALAALLLGATPALATIPYTPLASGGAPTIGPGIASPKLVYGKEYSHDFDQTTAGLGGGPDAQQVISWDGSGGTTDSVDFTGTRPSYTSEDETDAIAAGMDALYNDIRSDRAHLIFSHDDEVTLFSTSAAGIMVPALYTVPSGGPVFLSNGNAIGGAGEVSVEGAGVYHPPSSQGVWATLPDVNGMPLPRDVDGLEVWGPEPPALGDTDKYSLDLDFFSGTSVWNASGSSYVSHPAVVAAVTSLLGGVPLGATLPYDNADGNGVINLDALMVNDLFGDDEFEGTAGAGSDEIIFSIRQVVDTTDPSGYYATGSELFVMDATGGVSFLHHGGHVWDKMYALTDLTIVDPLTNLRGTIDINAIEAIGQNVPEPAGAVLLLGLFASATVMRWRLG